MRRRLFALVVALAASLTSLGTGAQEGPPTLHLDVLQGEGRSVAEAIAALPLLQPQIAGCEADALRAYPQAQLTATLSLTEQGVVERLVFATPEDARTAPWRACAERALRQWRLPRGVHGTITLQLDWRTPTDSLRAMGLNPGGNWGVGGTHPNRPAPSSPPTTPLTVRVAWLAPVTSGAIVPREVSRGLLRSSAFRTCAETHAAHTQVTSRIEVRFTILPDGSVSQLDVTNDPPELAECVRSVLAQVRYGPSAAATLVVTAFVVRPL
jgi:hypothetical protein